MHEQKMTSSPTVRAKKVHDLLHQNKSGAHSMPGGKDRMTQKRQAETV